MVDIVDRAQAREAELLEDALARARGPLAAAAASRVHCQDCDGPIPAARRRAVPGCTTCVDCQDARERRAKQERT
jgi:phage/conjugal plasmid C-4 type zinc finger TraR family protein